MKTKDELPDCPVATTVQLNRADRVSFRGVPRRLCRDADEPEEIGRIRNRRKRTHSPSMCERFPSARSTAATNRFTAGEGSFAIMSP